MLHFTKGGNYKTYPLQKGGIMLHFTKGGSYAPLYKRGELCFTLQKGGIIKLPLFQRGIEGDFNSAIIHKIRHKRLFQGRLNILVYSHFHFNQNFCIFNKYQ